MSAEHEHGGRGWSGDELATIGEAIEIDIAPRRRDGTLGRRVTIWVVAVGGDLLIRSWRGRTAAWYRSAQLTHACRIWADGLEEDARLVDTSPELEAEIDAAFRSKYRPHGTDYVEDMVAPEARATTMRLEALTPGAEPPAL